MPAPVSSSKTGSLRLHPTMKIAEPIPAGLAVCRKMAMDRVLIRTIMGGYQAQSAYQQPGQMQGGSYPASGMQPQNGYQPAQPNGYSQQGAANNYGQPPQNGYQQPNMAGQNPPPQQNNGYMPPNGASGGMMQGGNPGDGFSHVPEHQAGDLPFAA